MNIKQNSEIIHAKICRHSGIVNKGIADTQQKSNSHNKSINSAISDPWVFDIQWTAYPWLWP